MRAAAAMERFHKYTDIEADILMTAILHFPDDAYCMNRWSEQLEVTKKNCAKSCQLIVVEWSEEEIYAVFDYPKARKLPHPRFLIAMYHKAKAMRAERARGGN